MRKSSAAQLELNLPADTAVGESAPTVSGEAPLVQDSSTASFPSFNASTELHAIAARQAGRLNAASISQQEVDDLLAQRQRLLDKKYTGNFTRADEIRLEYVRWSLDRIEDARYGSELDKLESSVALYERFMTEVQDLKRQLRVRQKGRR
jgi:hypothetical protein